MKISNKNILFIFLLLILFAFAICVLNNKTLIEKLDNYGDQGCDKTDPKVLNINNDQYAIDNAISCLMEQKSISLGN